MAQESSLKIHYIRIAVENPGQVFAFTHTAFHQLQGIEPEVGAANVYVMAVAVRDDFYLLHFQLRLKLFVSAL